MASLRPNLYAPGIYNPVVQSNPKIDLYVKGIINPRVSAKYRHKQKHPIDRNPQMDRIQGPLQGPAMTPSAMSMIGSGKNKSKVRAPFAKGNASKTLAFYNEAGISAKRTPKMIPGTVGKTGSTTIAREPSFHTKLGRYVK
jgi:hypothetical protein